MAIIRKGDKEAEGKLRQRAMQDMSAKSTRSVSSAKAEKDALAGKKVSAAGAKAKKEEDTKGVTGAVKVLVKRGPAKDLKPGSIGPVSGSLLGMHRQAKKHRAQKGGSGVIQSGKVVKGGSNELKNNLDAKGKK